MNKKISNRTILADQSPGNKMASFLDDRRNAWVTIQNAKHDLDHIERRLTVMIMKDPVGFEGCISINWRKLEKMFGG